MNEQWWPKTTPEQKWGRFRDPTWTAAAESRTVELAAIVDYGPGMTTNAVKELLARRVKVGVDYYRTVGLDGLLYADVALGPIRYQPVPTDRDEYGPERQGLRSMRASVDLTLMP